MQFWTAVIAVELLISLVIAFVVARAMGFVSFEPAGAPKRQPQEEAPSRAKPPPEVTFIPPLRADHPIHVLVVDDDAHLRDLIRTTFELAHVVVEEADAAAVAAKHIAAHHPDVVVLDVGMPGVDGITFCQALKSDPRTRGIPVILLTGNDHTEHAGWEAGASAFLTKPFRPLELLSLVERLADAGAERTEGAAVAGDRDERQVLLYAQDLRQLLELERGQRRLLQGAYRETVVALAQALEAKEGGMGAHSERVRRYATELVSGIQPALLKEPGAEYGFILHDVGKIAIPDAVLRKNGELTEAERRLIETHPVLGEQMVGNASLLRGAGAQVVRSHHERWDGRGYPDGLAGEEIPLPARIFTIADALDAMTSDRPYRGARPWAEAVDEIVAKAGTQFDPEVVDVFRDREEQLRRVYYEVSAN